MAKDLNRFTCTGRLGADPDVRYMPNGDPAASIRIAVSDAYKDKSTGQMVDKTEWVTFKAFGKLAEICGEYLKKGSRIYAEGKLETRKYQDKDGTDKYVTEVRMENMLMLDGKPAVDTTGGAPAPARAPAPAQARRPAAPAPRKAAAIPDDDEPPF